MQSINGENQNVYKVSDRRSQGKRPLDVDRMITFKKILRNIKVNC
jgi:hypothetical protein